MNRSDNQNNEKHARVNETDSGVVRERKEGIKDYSEQEINESFPDYPPYPPDEDIYNIYKKEEEVDIEQPYSGKTTMDKTKPLTLKEQEEEDFIADDLDIPGAELDDEQEFIGSEDEENNYYSLGGDNHDDLDENRDDDYD